MRGIITSKRSLGRIVAIARGGTKRQRKKYRNTYAVLCKDDCYLLGRLYPGSDILQARLDRAERRRGYPAGSMTEQGIKEPAWHGVRGMVGMYWTWHDGVWSGRTPEEMPRG